MKYILSTDDDGCEHATELPLQSMQDEQLKEETNSDHTKVVLNCDHPASSGSTADPDENSAEAVSDFCDCLV